MLKREWLSISDIRLGGAIACLTKGRFESASVPRKSLTQPIVFPASRWNSAGKESHTSKRSVRISERDLVIGAPPGKPVFYQWDIPLSENYPGNPGDQPVKLGTSKMIVTS